MSNIYGAPQSEVMKPQGSSTDGLTDTMLAHLSKGKPWAKFLAIVQYLYAGVIVIGVLFAAFSLFSESLIAALAVLVCGGLIAYISFIMGRFMFRYATAVEMLNDSQDIQFIEEAQDQFGKYCRLFVVLIIVGIVVGIIGAVLFFSFMASTNWSY